jgi:hypothetical protein
MGLTLVGFWKTKQFKELHLVWSQKLEESGFEDAEICSGNNRLLKQRASNSYRQASELERQLKLEYFLRVGQEAERRPFDCEFEAVVIRLHAEGSTIQEITQRVQQQGFFKKLNKPINRRTIRFIIRRYQMKWGIKSWTPAQLNLKKTFSK